MILDVDYYGLSLEPIREISYQAFDACEHDEVEEVCEMILVAHNEAAVVEELSEEEIALVSAAGDPQISPAWRSPFQNVSNKGLQAPSTSFLGR